MRALIVDDHPLVLEVVRGMVDKALDHPAIHCASSLEEAIAHVRSAGVPDLTVLDLGLPGCTGIEALTRFCASGIEALTRFRASFPSAAVVILSATEDPAVVNAALEAGAKGYLFKTSTRAVMQAALALVAAGGSCAPLAAAPGPA